MRAVRHEVGTTHGTLNADPGASGEAITDKLLDLKPSP